MTIPVSSNDGKDYRYSWFIGNINVDNIPAGDYSVYIQSMSDDYYSRSAVQTKLLNEEISQYNTDSK